MALVSCPGCGQAVEIDRFHRDAGEFCDSCDFPLFFTSGGLDEDELVEPARGPSAPAHRRLPGTAGRDDLVGEACPACSELNLAGADYCHRCGAPMVTAPEPAPTPVAPAPAPTPDMPPPAPAPDVPFPWVPVVALGTLILVLLIIAAVTVARL